MKAIAIDTGDGCVALIVETIGDGSYGFSRTLYIYVNNAKAAENPPSRPSSTCTCPRMAWPQ